MTEYRDNMKKKRNREIILSIIIFVLVVGFFYFTYAIFQIANELRILLFVFFTLQIVALILIIFRIYLYLMKYLVSISENTISLPRERMFDRDIIININELDCVGIISGEIAFHRKTKNIIFFQLDNLDNSKRFLQALKKILIKNRVKSQLK